MKFVFLILFFPSITCAEIKGNENIPKALYTCYRKELIKMNIAPDLATLGPNDSEVPVCFLSFRIDGISPAHYYFSRKAHSPEYCENFKKNWDEEYARQGKVCIAGRLGESEKRKHDGKEILEKSDFWEVIRTEKWCHSYFEGYCDE